MVRVSVCALYILELLYGALFALFFTGKSVVGSRCRLALFYYLSGIEQNALKAVIACVLFRRRSAVTLDYKIFVSYVVIVHVIPAESVHTYFGYAFWYRHFGKLIAAKKRRLINFLHALGNGEVCQTFTP